MQTFNLHIYLQEPVVFSQTAASLGGHASLDYIPGAVLQGACAAKLYAKFKEKSFAVFHQGQVKFSNAYPLTANNDICYPMPFVWFHQKGVAAEDAAGQLNPAVVHNLALADEETFKQKQPKQLRNAYVSDQLQIVKPQLRLRMKTAIDPGTARAAKSQLFAYQSLEAGQSFCSSIYVDDDIDPDTLQQIKDSLQGEVFLGRSRSAQYGKVTLEWVKVDAEASSGTNETYQCLWLQSDLALNDKNGLPVTQDTFEQALALSEPQLSGREIDWKKTQLRFRRYSPYNAYRKAYDQERQVMEKGSVIYFKPADNTAITTASLHMGLYQSQGLGLIAVNHPLLAAQNPELQSVRKARIDTQTQTEPVKPDSLLLHWLESRQSQQAIDQSYRQTADKLAKQLSDLYENARLYAGAAQNVLVGPSATQWSRVAEHCKKEQLPEQLLGGLFGSSADNTSDAICKPKDEGWGVETRLDNNPTTFTNWLQTSLKSSEIKDPATVASLLARKARDYINRQKAGAQA